MMTTRRLHYHRTDGGAEYLMDAYVTCPDGHREGTFQGARIVVRLDGDPQVRVSIADGTRFEVDRDIWPHACKLAEMCAEYNEGLDCPTCEAPREEHDGLSFTKAKCFRGHGQMDDGYLPDGTYYLAWCLEVGAQVDVLTSEDDEPWPAEVIKVFAPGSYRVQHIDPDAMDDPVLDMDATGIYTVHSTRGGETT